MRLTHIRLLVDDLASARRFYEETVGLKVSLDAGVYVEFESGPSTLSLYRRDLMEQVAPQRQPHGPGAALIFQVDDVDAKVAELKGRGLTLETDPHDQEAWYLRVAHFRDPEGNLVELCAPLSRPR